ncbi:MAG: hypothetical protein JJT93_14690 [Gammaproteobacteria bacterium]|nr:hypothetical protein [Gammaproteobacteria bacterium]
MSKIQDALSKLQRNRASESPPRTDSSRSEPSRSESSRSGASGLFRQLPPEEVEPFARTVDRLEVPFKMDGSKRRAHHYGGRLLSVDRAQLRAAGLLAPESQERKLADEYRQIKRPLITSAMGRGNRPLERANLLMVASAVSGEGKTFTCINLCLSIATEKDWSVVLVDADCAKPHVSRLFGVEDAPGLLDALRDHDLELESLICPTDVPGLAVLPAGGRDELAAELLASARMESLCAALSAADPKRMIVFDSSPLLQTTEAPVVATHVGQVVVVVQADKTSQQRVTAALSKLDPEASISLVLNQAKGISSDAYGYGGYYGQYGQYGDEADTSAPETEQPGSTARSARA